MNLCKSALVNLSAAKFRSFLAVLGILIGTAAVVALISCGQMATAKAMEQFKSLGTDLLAVSVYKKISSKSQGDKEALTFAEWKNLNAHLPQVVQIAPYAITYQTLSFKGQTIPGSVIGAENTLARIVHISLERGHFISFSSSFERVCIIGNGIAGQIQKQTLDSVLGQQLQIGQYLYTIIGVASPWKENGFFYEDINQSVILPITGLALVSKNASILNAVLQLKSNSPIDEVIEDIKQEIHYQAPHLGVFTRSAKEIIASMNNQGHIFSLLLTVIGSISFLVGGIGVMNVMLVSVSERKKEIGIRKAVGAKNSEIQALFLVEALLLSLMGGALGVLVGLFFTALLAYWNAWSFSIQLLPSMAGFLLSAVVGVFFGFFPAYRAAGLEPIVSLRA